MKKRMLKIKPVSHSIYPAEQRCRNVPRHDYQKWFERFLDSPLSKEFKLKAGGNAYKEDCLSLLVEGMPDGRCWLTLA